MNCAFYQMKSSYCRCLGAVLFRATDLLNFSSFFRFSDIDGYDNHDVKGQMLSVYREGDPNCLTLEMSDAVQETACYNPGIMSIVHMAYLLIGFTGF